MKKTIMTLLALLTMSVASAQKSELPLVYDVEHTGSRFAAPKMPTIDKLPVVRELPDALEKVRSFKDWSKRRSAIGHMIQHYGIQVNDYKQFGKHHDRGEHNFDRLYPALKDNGAYSEWAWGMSRLIDGLQQLGPEVTKIDVKRIGVTGCSYAGKMALYCGAFDERIALTIAQEPGGGGAAAWRKSHESTLAGKNLEDLDKTDYHWFLESQKENFHGDSVYRLPYDQHELCAMVCPRALLLLGNPDYEWLADGSMLPSAQAALKVWERFGIADRMGWSIVGKHGHCQLPQTQWPEVQAFIDRFLLGRPSDTKNVRRVEDL